MLNSVIPDIGAISLRDRLALTDDGTFVPITALIDIDGDITEDIDQAVMFVCGIEDRWWVGFVSEYTVKFKH